MSSKAFQITSEDGFNTATSGNRVPEDVSFNYSHCSLGPLLELIGHYMPFDGGGMGVPLVIYRKELKEMEKRYKEVEDSRGNLLKILNRIRKDMDKKHHIYDNYWTKRDYVLYYLV